MVHDSHNLAASFVARVASRPCSTYHQIILEPCHDNLQHAEQLISLMMADLLESRQWIRRREPSQAFQGPNKGPTGTRNTPPYRLCASGPCMSGGQPLPRYIQETWHSSGSGSVSLLGQLYKTCLSSFLRSRQLQRDLDDCGFGCEVCKVNISSGRARVTLPSVDKQPAPRPW